MASAADPLAARGQVDGLINRWALSHRLLCQHVKHCQFINAAPSFALPSPFAGAASHAVSN